jgi:hypothetical protein
VDVVDVGRRTGGLPAGAHGLEQVAAIQCGILLIDGALAARLARATGFRNVLAHGQIESDDDLVVGTP